MKIFGMGGPELLIIVVLIVVLIIFGPKNLPKIGKSLGKTVKNVRDGVSGADEEEKPAEPAAAQAVAQEQTAAAPEVAVPIQQTEAPAEEAGAQQS